jgi:hypothetical protein
LFFREPGVTTIVCAQLSQQAEDELLLAEGMPQLHPRTVPEFLTDFWVVVITTGLVDDGCHLKMAYSSTH